MCLRTINLASSSALQLFSLAILPATLSSHTIMRQVESSQTTGSSMDSETEMFSRTRFCGEILTSCSAKHLTRGIVTSEPCIQVRRWTKLSSWFSQNVQAGDWTFPTLASLSLMGRSDWTILKRNAFCSGAKPNFLAREYDAGGSISGLSCSNLEGIRRGGAEGSSEVWVIHFSITMSSNS